MAQATFPYVRTAKFKFHGVCNTSSIKKRESGASLILLLLCLHDVLTVFASQPGARVKAQTSVPAFWTKDRKAQHVLLSETVRSLASSLTPTSQPQQRGGLRNVFLSGPLAASAAALSSNKSDRQNARAHTRGVAAWTHLSTHPHIFPCICSVSPTISLYPGD